MARHVLSLEAPDTRNKCILRIEDTSIYSPDLPVTCPILQITVPGFNLPVTITDITQGFNLNLTACDLDLQTQNCGTSFSNLPDGIYIIRYSIAPNDYVHVEYNHLRVTCALEKIAEILCALDIAACEPSFKIKEKLKELNLIEMMIKAAKASVEYCHNPKKGMDIYRYALKRLDKLSCNICAK